VWKSVFNKSLFRIGWVSRMTGALISWIVLSLLCVIAYIFGVFALNVAASILLCAIALVFLYWVIRIIVLFIQTK
jgi:hypothetical protein